MAFATLVGTNWDLMLLEKYYSDNKYMGHYEWSSVPKYVVNTYKYNIKHWNPSECRYRFACTLKTVYLNKENTIFLCGIMQSFVRAMEWEKAMECM